MKSTNVFRVYYQNINGIMVHNSWEKCKNIIDMLHEHEIDVSSLVETNLNWDAQRQQYVRTLLRMRNKQSILITSSSDDLSHQKYQPGGTGLILQNNIVGKIDKYDHDERGLGR